MPSGCDNVWDTDLRVARTFGCGPDADTDVRLVGDVFNVFNANTELARVSTSATGNDAQNGSFNALIKNMSPRIARFGLVVGF